MNKYVMRLVPIALLLVISNWGYADCNGAVSIYYTSVPDKVTSALKTVAAPKVADIKTKRPLDRKNRARLEKALKGASRWGESEKKDEEMKCKREEIASIGVAAVPVLADLMQSKNDVVRRDSCAALTALAWRSSDRNSYGLLTLLFCRSIYDRDRLVRANAIAGMSYIAEYEGNLPDPVASVLEQVDNSDPDRDIRQGAHHLRMKLGLIPCPYCIGG